MLPIIVTPVALFLGGCCLSILWSRTRRARAPLTYFALDLVYNLVFKFGLEKYTARQLMTSKLKISLGGRFVQSSQTRHHAAGIDVRQISHRGGREHGQGDQNSPQFLP